MPDNNDFRWTLWMAGLGIFIYILLFAWWSMRTGHLLPVPN